MSATPAHARHLRPRAILIALALLLLSTVGMTATGGPLAPLGLATAPARAGTYDVTYCGTPGVAENWSTGATRPGTSSGGACPGGRIFANLPQQTWVQNQASASITFTAPDNTTIAGWHPTLRFSAAKTTENTERIHFNAGATPNGNFPVQCINLGCPPVITDVPVYAGAKQITASAACVDERPDFTLCEFTADVSDTGGTVTLRDDTYPQARSQVTGSLTAAGAPRTAAKGTSNVHVLVDDTGSGIKAVSLQIDGTTVGTGPGCSPQPTTKVVPCPLTQDANITVDTTHIADGRHTAKLVATDASGNESTLWDTTIYVANTPIGPGSPDELRGDPIVPGATDDARITATWPSTARKPSKRCKGSSYRKRHRAACKRKAASSLWKGSYATKSGVTVTGRVTNKTTKGIIPNAPVVLTATVTRGGAAPIRLDTRTNENGRYSFKLPRNVGSRDLQIGTLARVNDERPATTTGARMLVRSTMRLHANRRTIRAGRSVRFTGALRDQGAGVPAVLEVYVGGKWRVFFAVSTAADGRFSATYKFGRDGRGVYRFRARARPTSSTPWPYVGSPSSTVRVRVR